MSRKCTFCDADGKYKCPTCLVYYCSVDCCTRHREAGCRVLEEPQKQLDGQFRMRYTTADTVQLEKLEAMRHDKTINEILCNPHLRDLLAEINASKDPEKIMQIAMQEPLFVEFADACLGVVEPQNELIEQ